MRDPLKRYDGVGGLHFVTFSCYRRRPLLATPRARNCFVKILDRVRCKRNFLLLGFVVMPEHVHLLVSEPAGKNLSVALQVLKQQVSRSLRKTRQRPGQGQPATKVCRTATGRKTFLATTVLRFQRLEREEIQREAGLHAREPGEAGTGFASQTLAVEQLGTLRAWRAMCAPCGLAGR